MKLSNMVKVTQRISGGNFGNFKKHVKINFIEL